MTTRAVLDLVAGEVGHPVAVRSVPKLVMRALGVFNPTMRELVEMTYEFDEPFVLDTTKYESTFGCERYPVDRSADRDGRLVQGAKESQNDGSRDVGRRAEPNGRMVETSAPRRWLHPAGLRRRSGSYEAASTCIGPRGSRSPAPSA